MFLKSHLNFKVSYSTMLHKDFLFNTKLMANTLNNLRSRILIQYFVYNFWCSVIITLHLFYVNLRIGVNFKFKTWISFLNTEF